MDLSGRGAVVAAVSGGGDSLALLFLLRDHLTRYQPDVGLVAVTVDHGIRPEAAMEAAAVAALCGRFGIRHRTMRWTDAKPVSGLQQAAREARYALLARAADEAGAGLVLTGHTLDDQLETVAMRKRRGDGRGLAGIAPATLYDGRLWVARPLLEARREGLRNYLRGIGIEWHEDPSNKDPKYERARTRLTLAGEASIAEDGAHAGLIAEMRRAAAERVSLGERAAALIRRHARRVSTGLYRLGREFAVERDREAATYALRILLAVVGGRAQLPDASRGSALLKWMSEAGARATLSRSVVEARADGLYLYREMRGLPLPGGVIPGQVWDGRHRIGPEAREAGEIAPFGREAAAALAAPDCEEPAALARAALAAEPALWRGVECLGHAPAVPLAAPWARFLPWFDLAPAQAATELVGGRPLPASPLAR
ncbi:MAG: tRNA lysidine(34) synthetase TilS [Rhizobiales bacterium 65-79]|nr:MAG: tRNA lysidine(34) synthetase TilS [Rhizobiales bacterium 65-79]